MMAVISFVTPKIQESVDYSVLLKSGLRSRSRSRSQSESVVLLGVGVGVGVDKIHRLRPTPGNLLFPIQRNRHADYLKHFSAQIYVVDWLDDRYRTQSCAALHVRHGNRSKFRT